MQQRSGKCLAPKPGRLRLCGAARTAQYVPGLRGKRVALFSNHTGMVGDKHTLDIMLGEGLNVVTLFRPNTASEAPPMPASTWATVLTTLPAYPSPAFTAAKAPNACRQGGGWTASML